MKTLIGFEKCKDYKIINNQASGHTIPLGTEFFAREGAISNQKLTYQFEGFDLVQKIHISEVMLVEDTIGLTFKKIDEVINRHLNQNIIISSTSKGSILLQIRYNPLTQNYIVNLNTELTYAYEGPSKTTALACFNAKLVCNNLSL